MAEAMHREAAIEKLNAALRLQYRSVLQYTFSSASIVGLEYRGLADKLRDFGEAELEDVRLLVEKVAALDGDPTTEVAPHRYFGGNAEQAVDWIIESEDETIEALHAVIPETGEEGRSEALEHLMEHVIARKQNQVDFLLRSSRAPEAG